MDTTVLRSMVPCSLPSIPHTLPAKRIRSCTQNALARGQGAEREYLIRGNLLGRSAYSVKVRGTMFVLGEHYVDLRIGRNGDDHAAVGIETHDFGIARYNRDIYPRLRWNWEHTYICKRCGKFSFIPS